MSRVCRSNNDKHRECARLNERVISAKEYDDFRQFLVDVTGIVLGDNKHYLVSSRLNRLMEEKQLSSYEELLRCVQSPANMVLREQVVDAMTTNETMWFRDTYPFEILQAELLPQLLKQKKSAIRIWSAACSSGQEPYSISMVAHEFAMKNPGALASGVEIIGTDISSTMLKYSNQAIYDTSTVNRGLSDERRKKYFKENESSWELKSEIRAGVKFKALNLQHSFKALGKFDIIFCRNVLIYFSSEFKTDILTRMSEVLNPGGYLLLGSSETPTRYTSLYKMVKTSKGVIYQFIK